jgi:hypothetical protein
VDYLVAADTAYTVTVTPERGALVGMADTSTFFATVLSIGSTLKRWWSTRFGTLKQNSDGTGDVTTLNDPVGYIPDRSANADHLLQATADNKGRYKPTGFNGFPAVEIVTDDFFSFTSLALTNFTIFAVYDSNAVTANFLNYFLGGTNQGVYAGGSLTGANGYGVFDGTNFREANEEPETPEIFVFQNAKLYKNGVEATYDNTGIITGLTLTTLGRRPDSISNRFNGVFTDIIIADTHLSSDQINAIGQYLATATGETWNDI